MNSYPTPEHVARVQVIGPHFDKIFLPDRWNPFHVLKAADTGPPHCHPYRIVANILIGGYIETIWILRDGGGYTVRHDVQRRPRTTHVIEATTIHLITGLPEGFSITEAEPEEARRDWFFYLPQEDGSMLRSTGFDGPWEAYHPAGPVEHLQG